MISENTISKVMGEMGKRGTGKSKRRGDANYYSEMAKKRKPKAKKRTDSNQ